MSSTLLPSISSSMRKVFPLVALFSFVAIPLSSFAGTIKIGLLGLDLVYDGDSLYDAGGIVGGAGDPADADPLIAVTIEVDGILAGPVLVADIFADIDIPVELPLPASPGVSMAVSDGGIFDLLIGPGPSSPEGILIDVDEVSVTFVDALTAQFVFGAEVTSDIAFQSLPFGLEMGTPINISFNADIVPGTFMGDGTFITDFEASGSANISGPEVPEPSSIALVMLSLASLSHRGWPRQSAASNFAIE